MNSPTPTAGLDWASQLHQLCIVDPAGIVLVNDPVEHHEPGITAMLETLTRFEVDQIAIERPDGLLVDRLLQAGITVIAIHPNHVAAARPRYAAAGQKDDRLDAYVLAELARTDAHRFRTLTPASDATKALRALVRGRSDLVTTRVATGNQLRAVLERCWPAAIDLFSRLDSQIGLAFLTRYPTAQDARTLGPRRLEAFLQKHRYSGRRAPDALLQHLKNAARPVLGPAETATHRQLVLALVQTIELLNGQARAIQREITLQVRAHPDGQLFQPFFRDPQNTVTLATIVCEIGEDRTRYRTVDALCAHAGMAPITIQSGKHRGVKFRRACNHRLRQAIATLADSTRHWHPWAKAVYERARERGLTHPRAIRTLGRAWLRVIHACWLTKTAYDPARHRAHQAALTN